MSRIVQRRVEAMGNNLEEMFLIFDVLDRWGLDEVESVLCPVCNAENGIEVIEPEELQEESCGRCGARYEIDWRIIQNEASDSVDRVVELDLFCGIWHWSRNAALVWAGLWL